MSTHRIQQPAAQRGNLRGRLRPDVDPEIVRADDGSLVPVLLGEVPVGPSDDARHGARTGEDPHLLRLESLIPERVTGASPDPVHTQVSVLGDLAHRVARTIQRAGDDASGRAGAHVHHQVAPAVRAPPWHRVGQPRGRPGLVPGGHIERNPGGHCLESFVSGSFLRTPGGAGESGPGHRRGRAGR